MERAATIDNPAPDIDASVKSLGIFLLTEYSKISVLANENYLLCHLHILGYLANGGKVCMFSLHTDTKKQTLAS